MELAGTCRARLSSAPAPPPPKSMQVERALVARGKCQGQMPRGEDSCTEAAGQTRPTRTSTNESTNTLHHVTPFIRWQPAAPFVKAARRVGRWRAGVTCSSPTSSLPLHLLLSVRSVSTGRDYVHLARHLPRPLTSPARRRPAR